MKNFADYCENLIPNICLIKLLHIKMLIKRDCWENINPLSKCLLCKKRDALLQYMTLYNTDADKQIRIPKNVRGGCCIKCGSFALIEGQTPICNSCRKGHQLRWQTTRNIKNPFLNLISVHAVNMATMTTLTDANIAITAGNKIFIQNLIEVCHMVCVCETQASAIAPIYGNALMSKIIKIENDIIGMLDDENKHKAIHKTDTPECKPY